jgi:hypothetical protein
MDIVLGMILSLEKLVRQTIGLESSRKIGNESTGHSKREISVASLSTNPCFRLGSLCYQAWVGGLLFSNSTVTPISGSGAVTHNVVSPLRLLHDDRRRNEAVDRTDG